MRKVVAHQHAGISACAFQPDQNAGSKCKQQDTCEHGSAHAFLVCIYQIQQDMYTRTFHFEQGLLRFANLGKAQRFVSRYSDRLFWHVSSCSLSMRKLSNRPSTLHASRTLGFLAVSCIIFFQDLSMPSKRLASCKTNRLVVSYYHRM